MGDLTCRGGRYLRHRNLSAPTTAPAPDLSARTRGSVRRPPRGQAGALQQRVARLAEQLADHVPVDPAEARSLGRTRRLLTWLRDPFDEHADPTHVTGSAIVCDEDGRVLLHRHKRLGIWVQPGGHVDPGETCEQAALREAEEETGVAATLALPVPLHVDVHQGPRGHVHLDVRWLLHAAGGQVPAPGPGESPDVAWLTPTDALARTDAAAGSAIRAALALRRARGRALSRSAAAAAGRPPRSP